ncbi:MAG TPA: hypothetical protein VF710_10990 [Longimicrobium sp.]|jgi:hypothetical protein
MKNPILSVHIYKTGGTTFRNLLTELPRTEVVLDYGDMPLARAAPARRLKNTFRTAKVYAGVRRRMSRRDRPRVFIHGHYVASKYEPLFPSAGLVTWLRDPVERVASHYHFWLRHPNRKHPICQRLIAEKLSLPEFAEVEGMRNVHSRLLGGRNIAEFDFVGITEEYDRSMALFLDLFTHGGEAPAVAPVNQNPEKGGLRYEIDEEARARILACNATDIAIYEAGRLRFEELCELHAK